MNIKYKLLRWIVKKYGVCFFRHKNEEIVEYGMTNCMIKCHRCGETWTML